MSTPRSDCYKHHTLHLGNIHHPEVNPPETEAMWHARKYQHLKHYTHPKPKDAEEKRQRHNQAQREYKQRKREAQYHE